MSARRPAMVLPVVLVLVGLLALAMAGFIFFVRAEVSGARAERDTQQARLTAESGLQEVTTVLRKSRDDPTQWFDVPDKFRHVLVWSEGYKRDADPVKKMGSRAEILQNSAPIPAWRYSVVAPSLDGLEGMIRYGITPENSKLNLNTASEGEIERLFTDVFADLGVQNGPELVACLLDWLDDDDEVRPGGAESDYYRTLTPGYVAKNGPLDSVEELLLIKGFSAALLYGEDTNRNGLLDANEDDGDQTFPYYDNADGRLAHGLADYVTVWSRDKIDLQSSGTPSGGTPSGGTPSGGAPSGGTPSGGTPSGGTPSGGKPSGANPSGGTPAGGNVGGTKGSTGSGGSGTNTKDSGSRKKGTYKGLGGSQDPPKNKQDPQPGGKDPGKATPDTGGGTKADPGKGPSGGTPGAASPSPGTKPPAGSGGKGPAAPSGGAPSPSPGKGPPSADPGKSGGDSGQPAANPGAGGDKTGGDQPSQGQPTDDQTGGEPQGGTPTGGDQNGGDGSQTTDIKINVNVASARVLRALDGMTPDGADRIIALRKDQSADTLKDVNWLVETGALDAETFAAVKDRLTTQSLQFHVEIVAYADHTKLSRREEWIIEMRGPLAQVLYHRDLTALGFAWPVDDDTVVVTQK